MTTRVTNKVPLPYNTIGTQMNLVFHRYGPTNSGGKAYIQASLHADELPGLLVAHHLINMLEEADKKQLIQKEIVIVPFANPIGLSQGVLGLHMGRFNLATGVNFNRSFVNVGEALVTRVEGKLHQTDEAENIRIVREAFKKELDERTADNRDAKLSEDVMKLMLIREACDADIVLDLHCDTGQLLICCEFALRCYFLL